MEKKTYIFFIILLIVICLFALYYFKMNYIFKENFAPQNNSKMLQANLKSKKKSILTAKQQARIKERDQAVINAPQNSKLKKIQAEIKAKKDNKK